MEKGGDRWAKCAITELGFIRISSNAAGVGASKSPGEAARLLAEMVRDPLHVYLESMPSPTGKGSIGLLNAILRSRQVIDVYLLSLARRHRKAFVTFDARLAALSGLGGEVEVLSVQGGCSS